MPSPARTLASTCLFRRTRGAVLAIACALINTASTSWAASAKPFLTRSPDWFSTEDARRTATHILSHQSDLGGWPKNGSTTDSLFRGDRRTLAPTFDNGATTDELRFLARVHAATQDETCRAAFLRGLDYILIAQYPNGGWPQFHPPGRGYHRHITFNDNTMVRLMEFVREVASMPTYAFVDAPRRARARAAFDRGIDCILNCQVTVDSKPTVWCAQHDASDFQPRAARTFEPASLSGAESVGITRLLMSLENPPPRVRHAVEAALAWFRSAALTGIRVETVPDPAVPGRTDRVVVKDASAPPLWARFYHLETQQPVFTDRDGIPRANLRDLGHERRNGYAWYGNWPQQLLDREAPAWRHRISPPTP